MHKRRRLWRWLGGIALGLLALGLVVRAWVVPALIVRALQARYEGRVSIRDWWLNGHSVGLVGLVLHEGRSERSPVWAQAEQVEADLTPGQIVRGNFVPRRVVVRGPRVALRFDADGHLLTLPRFKTTGPTKTAIPQVIVQNARVDLHQEGRPPMVVSGVNAQLDDEQGGAGVRISAVAEDPTRGHCELHGHLGPTFRTGEVELVARRINARPARVKEIPFVPLSVWRHVLPTGPVAVRMNIAFTGEPARPLHTRTLVQFEHTRVDMPSLQLTSLDTVGPLTVEDGVVRLDHVRGRVLDGPVELTGPFDFSQSPARINLDLKLDHIDLAQAPSYWQLGTVDARGRFTGRAQLRVVLAESGPDFSRSSAEGDVTEALVQGMPVKRLHLTAGPASERAPAPPARAGFRPPAELHADFALDDVAVPSLAHALAAHGVRVPVSVGGRLTSRGQATIPLQALNDPRGYVFHGQVLLDETTLAGANLGRLETTLDLDQGTLVLSELRGRLADPAKGAQAASAAIEQPVPATGELPPGSYRGRLKAELAPPGRLALSLEARKLPAGGLARDILPAGASLTGEVSLTAEADALVASASDPLAWSARGHVSSDQLLYRANAEAQPLRANALATQVSLEQGRVVFNECSLMLEEQPVRGQVEVGLNAPHAFAGSVTVNGWSLGDIAALVQGHRAAPPATGALTVQAEVEGTLVPWRIETQGGGRLESLRAGPVPVGEVAFHWTTDNDTVVVAPIEARPFGGHVVAQVRLDNFGRGAIRGSARLTGIDTQQLTRALPRAGLAFSGKASGEATFSLPSDRKTVQGQVHLSAPEFRAQGMPTESVVVDLKAEKGQLTYNVQADSLGGKVHFQGAAPLEVEPARATATSVLHISNFSLASLWKAIGLTGPLARVGGFGSLDATLRSSLASFALRAHGVAEFRDLHWGGLYPLGHLRGVIVMTPTTWRVEPVTGHLLGGTAQGSLWGDTPVAGPHHLAFDLRIDRASLSQALAMLTTISRHITGFGTLRVGGRFDEALHVSAELTVPAARLFGLPLSGLRLPAELTVAGASGNGTLHLHRWTARLAGGTLRGDGHFRLGEDHAFRTEVHLTDLDLETLARIETEARRPASGKVSGRIELYGPHPSDLKKLKGRITLDLDDASIVELPVFKELDRFLGSARGGLFEDGDVVASIANRQVIIDQLTLEGRAVQLIGSGTIGFDGQLNLMMVVNTNQLISETGQALVGLIPGLRDLRGPAGRSRVASYLSARLLKFRVTGTLRSPVVSLDPSINVGDAAVGFFAEIFELPANLFR